MTSFGYTLSSEEHGPAELIGFARRAEELGFDFVSISDHYHPWTSAQGHSPFVWGVLGALAEATEKVDVGVGVTCPMCGSTPRSLPRPRRPHRSCSKDASFGGWHGRSSQRAHHWRALAAPGDPPRDARRSGRRDPGALERRHRRSSRSLLRGRERAPLRPAAAPIPVIVSGFGTSSAELRAAIGDGYWGTSPDPELLGAFAKAGGHGPRYAQLTICWASDEETAKKTVHDIWPNAGSAGSSRRTCQRGHTSSRPPNR